MPTTDKEFTGSIPEVYERDLVPLIFEAYARDVAARVMELQPRDVLETASGTGVVTRALASVLPKATRVVATDLNPAMLNVARARLQDTNVDGSRLMPWNCRSRIKASMSWSASSA